MAQAKQLRWNLWWGALGLLVAMAAGLWLNGKVLNAGAHGLVSTVKVAPRPVVTYIQKSLPQGVVHVVHVPPGSGYVVVPAVSERVAEAPAFAQRYAALAVINGGYFDPSNRKTTSYVITPDGVTLKPEDNEKLVGNPAISVYMPAILNRSEWRVLFCPKAPASEPVVRYQIVPHQAEVPSGCQLNSLMGAGPQLEPADTRQQEAFVAGRPKAYTRDPLGVDQLNARSAVGLSSKGDVWLVMVAQTEKIVDKTGKGLSLSALAEVMKGLGAETILALDGGTSSQLWMNGKHYIGKRRPDGEPVTRKVKSVLMVVPESSWVSKSSQPE